MPERVAGAIRRAAIYTIQSLRARTIKAPKKMRKNEYSLTPMRGAYITRENLTSSVLSNGEKSVLHRWEFKHIPTSTKKHFAAYATRRRSKETKWKWRGLKLADERREIIQAHDLLRIRRAGLAKLSWGWCAKQIVGSHASVSTWKRMRGERRDPRNFVKGLFSRTVNKGAVAEIKNALDYILDALQPGAIGQALNAASKKLEYNLREEVRRLTA
ncbi:MAG: hypothetical protein K6G94_09685 [Kiritimatiellae bacterium]|nr:hypothetical protein [Kiritimatiellia bacterium]